MWRHLADYSTWIHKAYALTRQLQGQKTFLARNTSGDSEHSDSSPATSPPATEKIIGAFSFDDMENYRHSSELCEGIISLRSVFVEWKQWCNVN